MKKQFAFIVLALLVCMGSMAACGDSHVDPTAAPDETVENTPTDTPVLTNTNTPAPTATSTPEPTPTAIVVYMQMDGTDDGYRADLTDATGDVVIASEIDGCSVTSIYSRMGISNEELLSIHPSISSVVIPDTVTEIGTNTFYFCSNLKEVTIPSGVTYIGDLAFCGCESLTSITIPDSVTYIGEAAFASCKSLTSIIIPDSVTSISDDMFMGCTNLTSVTISSNVTSIGSGAFMNCDSLTSVVIPDGVTSIEDLAFFECKSLTSVTIPASVTYIYDGPSEGGVTGVFARCDSLTAIYVKEGSYAERRLKEIGYESLVKYY